MLGRAGEHDRAGSERTERGPAVRDDDMQLLRGRTAHERGRERTNVRARAGAQQEVLPRDHAGREQRRDLRREDAVVHEALERRGTALHDPSQRDHRNAGVGAVHRFERVAAVGAARDRMRRIERGSTGAHDEARRRGCARERARPLGDVTGPIDPHARTALHEHLVGLAVHQRAADRVAGHLREHSRSHVLGAGERSRARRGTDRFVEQALGRRANPRGLGQHVVGDARPDGDEDPIEHRLRTRVAELERARAGRARRARDLGRARDGRSTGGRGFERREHGRSALRRRRCATRCIRRSSGSHRARPAHPSSAAARRASPPRLRSRAAATTATIASHVLCRHLGNGSTLQREPQQELADLHLVGLVDHAGPPQWLLVHERAVGRVEIEDRQRAARDEHARVGARHARVGQHDVVRRHPPDRDLGLAELRACARRRCPAPRWPRGSSSPPRCLHHEYGSTVVRGGITEYRAQEGRIGSVADDNKKRSLHIFTATPSNDNDQTRVWQPDSEGLILKDHQGGYFEHAYLCSQDMDDTNVQAGMGRGFATFQIEDGGDEAGKALIDEWRQGRVEVVAVYREWKLESGAGVWENKKVVTAWGYISTARLARGASSTRHRGPRHPHHERQ